MKLKFKNILLISMLAVAGIFSATAVAFNKQTDEQPVAEKAEASVYNATFEGKSGNILYVKGNKGTYFPGSYYCAIHLWGGNSPTAADNDIYVCNDNYAPYNDGTNYYFALRVPFGTGGVSVTYTNVQVCRQTPSKGHDNYTSEISISTIKNKPTNLIQWTGWGAYSITTDKYTHYGIKSGDHLYVDVSSNPGWMDASSTDNTHITFFVTATNGDYTYIYLWGDNGNNHAWPGNKIYDQGAWVYTNGSSQGVAAISIDITQYKHMIIAHSSSGAQSNTYDFSSSSKYKGFYYNGHNTNVGEWNAGSDYSTNAKIGVYFSVSNTYNGDAWGTYRNGETYTTAYARKVEGQSNKYLYEVIVPQQSSVDVVWNLVIVGRFKTTSSSPNWDDKLHQKSNFYFDSSSNACNEFKITGWTDSMYTCSDTISNDTRASYYGKYFLDTVKCSGTGTTDATTSAMWTAVKDEYNKYLSKAVQGILWTSTTTGSDNVSKAMARYDYIVFFKKYNHEDFISRDDSDGNIYKSYNGFSSLTLLGSLGDNFSTIVIVLSSSIALLSVTTLSILVIRKRKSKEQ